MRYNALIFFLILAACKQANEDKQALGGSEKPVITEAKPIGGNGPFGIEMGNKLEALDAEERNSESGVSILRTVPKPSTQFPLVAVVSYPSTGVCEIRALTKEFDSDSFLNISTPFVDEVAASLDTRYGKGKKIAGCSGYACESQYKLQGIENGSVWYGYEWASGKSPLPANINKISLYIDHARFNDSHVRLDYQFNNEAQCETASKTAKVGNL